MFDEKAVLTALQALAESVKQKSSQTTSGEPEDQLRGPFETFMSELGKVLSYRIVCTGETKLEGRTGKPDYAVHLNNLLAGYVELKSPGVGANPNRFKGHNRDQWKRFQAIPNLLYCDGNEWGLYRSGEPERAVVRLSGDIVAQGKKAAKSGDAHALLVLLLDFLQWEPIIPKDAKGIAALLAPLCRMLRDDVAEALKDEQSPLVRLAADWRQLLFPEAGDEQFADAYAQTLTFALLLAQSEGVASLTLAKAVNTLAVEHNLLSRALQVLTDPSAQEDISASLNLLLRIIGVVPHDVLTGSPDPWLYFYEDFLAAYNPQLRKNAGAYYTPVEVVQAQVRLIDDLLVHHLDRRAGFVDRKVVTLDPAVGTGTYLLGVIDHALRRVEQEQGPGAVPGQANALADNLFGFEIMVGPYAVAELRVSRALLARGAHLPKDGPGIYLTDTLESPHTEPPQSPLFFKVLADQHEKALKIKENVPVIVCLGNPPYDRHEAAVGGNRAQTGGWVRWGDLVPNSNKGGKPQKLSQPIFEDFLKPAVAAGHGIHVKNLYNLYVYFWRWALWKVFEHESGRGPGVVSFISASSYLDGPGFIGMREHLRRVCDEIWIIDLGGEGRGTRKTDNVFDIQTPVAIAVAARYGKPKPRVPAVVHYAKLEGTRREKLAGLARINRFTDLAWADCPREWPAPFRPLGQGTYFDWPLLTGLFPWQHSGLELKRTWPIGPDPETLKTRWRELLRASDRAKAFRETGDRTVNGSYLIKLTENSSSTPIAKIEKDNEPPPIIQYGYRSFDRQFLLADARLMSRPRPSLWQTHSKYQIYLASQLNYPIGKGPALATTCEIPDRHYFAGRGGKDIIPFFRDHEAREANITPGLLELMEKEFGGQVKPADFAAYAYGILAHPAFTARFAEELNTRELRVPLTKDRALFQEVGEVGRRLLWLHTYGQRFAPKGISRGQIPPGTAKCIQAVSAAPDRYPENYRYTDTTKTLTVGDGRFHPVAPEIWEFEVSGLKVVKSWLDYRMKKGAGRKSSPLDDIRPERWTADFTTEILELLWVLEATIADYPGLAELLDQVIRGPLFTAAELPAPPEAWRKPPTRHTLL